MRVATLVVVLTLLAITCPGCGSEIDNQTGPVPATTVTNADGSITITQPDGEPKYTPTNTAEPVTEDVDEADLVVEDDSLTNREEDYLNDISADAPDSAEASETIAELSPEWPLWSDEELVKVAGALATYRTMYSKWKKRAAPSARFRKLRRLWVGCLADYSRFSTLYAAGIDSMNESKLMTANKYMNRGTAKARKASREIDNLWSLYGY